MLIIKNGKTIGALQLFRVRKTGIVARQNAKDVVVFHGEEEQDRKVMKKILWMLQALHAGEIEKKHHTVQRNHRHRRHHQGDH